MKLKAQLSNAIAIIQCTLFHRRHWVVRIVGLFDARVECQKCGRQWWAN